MHITRVELENFKRHSHASFDFKPGVNAICGPNGAGKSSIVEAIGFALFDVNTYRRMSDLIRRGSRRARIAVEFIAEADEGRYLVERIITETSNRWTLYGLEPHRMLAERNEDVLQGLKDLMEVERETNLRQLFSEILGVAQGSFTGVFLAGSSDRQKVFEPLLQVEEYRRASERMRPLWLNALRSHQSGLEARASEIERRTLERPTKEAELHAIEATIQAQTSEILDLQTRLPSEQAQAEVFRKQEQAFRDLERDKRNCEGRLRSVAADLPALQSQAEAALKAAEITRRSADGYHRYKEAETRLRGLRIEEQTLKDAKQRQDGLLHQKAQTSLRLQSIASDIALLDEKAKELQAIQPLARKQEALQKERDLLQQAEIQRRSLDTLQDNDRQDLPRLESKLQDATSLLETWERLRPLKEEYEGLLTEGKRLREEQEAAKAKDRERKADVEALQQIEGKCRILQTEIQKTEDSLAQMRQHFGPIAQGIEEAEAHFTAARDALGALESRSKQEASFQGQLQGGVCPIFQARCKNLREGQSLDGFLAESLRDTETSILQAKKDLPLLKRAADDARNAQRKLDTEGRSLETKLHLLQNELRSEETRLRAATALVASKPDVSALIQTLETELHTKRERVTALKADAKKFDDLQRLGPADARERCLRDLQTKQAQISARHHEIAALQTKLQRLPSLRSEIESLGDPLQTESHLLSLLQTRPKKEKERSDLDAKIRSLESSEAELVSLLARWEPLQAALSEAQTTLEDTQEAFASYLAHEKVAASAAERLSNVQRKTADKERLSQELEALEAQIAPLRQTLEGVDTAAFYKATEDRNKRLIELSAILPKTKEKADDLRSQIHALQAEESRLLEIQSERADFEKMQRCSEVIRVLYNEAAPQLAKRLVASISREAARLFRELMLRPSMNLLWKHDQEDKFAIFLIEEDGSERDFKSLSGGEQMAAALAVRLALIKELSKIRIAFFDEPTAHMDETRRKQLASAIRSVQGFHQIFVISHDDTFESMIDHILWLERLDS